MDEQTRRAEELAELASHLRDEGVLEEREHEMHCYEVTTVLVIGTGLHFKYDYVVADCPLKAVQIARAHWKAQGYTLNGNGGPHLAEKIGMPLSGKVLREE